MGKVFYRKFVSVALLAFGATIGTRASASGPVFKCTFKYMGEDGYVKYYSFEISRDGRRDSPADLCNEDLKKQTNLPVAADKLEYYMYQIVRM